jgi:hypothetical protein
MKTDISKLNPCSDGAEYYESQPDFKTAWENCQRGDWMLWLASKLEVDIRTITLAKGLCAKTVLHLMKDERSIKAVDVAIEYGMGTITDDAMRYANINAHVAADASYAAAAASADAAAYAAADAAACAADAAAYAAADAAADADADADAYAARTENRRQTANICREVLTDAVYKKLGL